MPVPATPRILVVDDEEAILYVFERYLSVAGYDVSVANNGFEAVRAGEAGPFDLLSGNPVEAGTMPEGVRLLNKPVSMSELITRIPTLVARAG